MSEVTTRAVKPMDVRIIEINKIMKGYRYRENMGDMASLKQSITEHGLMHAIVVKEMEKSYKEFEYNLLAGGRRLTACIDLGHEKISCTVYPADLTELEQRLIELCENTDRKDMAYDEEVALTARIDNAMKELHGIKKGGAGGTATGHSLAMTADMLGKSPSLVSEEVMLAKALQVAPELFAGIKTKSDAMKMVKKMKKEFKHEEIVAKIESEKANTTEDIVRKGLMDSYIVGDFFTRIKDVQSASMDLIEVDTPFAIDLKGVKKAGEDTKLHYNEWEVEEFKNKCELVLSECYRVLKPNGWLLWWFAPEPWFESIYDWITKTGFKTRRMPCIWRKVEAPGQTMQPNIYLGNSYEMFYYARKGNAQINNIGRGNCFDFKPIAPANKIHPTEKPIEMYMNIYYTFVDYGSHILIPFLGSGNGILAASNIDMKALGFDLSKEYKNEYVLRVNDSIPPDYKSCRKE